MCAVLVCWAPFHAAPAQAQAAEAPPTTTHAAAEASLGHAALKGITLKAAQGLYSFGLFAVVAGVSTTVAAAMAVTDGVGAYGIYVGNEYLWDRFHPNTNLRSNNELFSVLDSLSRTTLKYITYKPAVTAWHWGVLYSMTGSMRTTVVAGSMMWFTLPLIYYVNNTGWDLYEWGSAPASTTAR